MKMLKLFLSLIFLTSLFFAQNTSLTIYNNLAVVKEEKEANLQKGTNKFYITGIPSQIDPSSIYLEFDGKILEQNYRYDVANKNSILNKFINKQIELEDKTGNKFSGKLISVSGNEIVLKKDNGNLLIISDLNNYRINISGLPDNFVNKPTLEYLAIANKIGKQKIKLIYFTNGISWTANYIALLNKSENKLTLNSWVNINNNSGANYNNAKIKLVAGEIHRGNNITPTPVYAMSKSYQTAESNFSTQPLFDYHVYELNRTTTIKNKESKQIILYETKEISVQKKYSLDFPAYCDSKKTNVNISIEFKNSKSNGLGIALPAGVIKVFKQNGETAEFIGEDNLSNISKNEKVNLNIGKAFDVFGKCIELAREKVSKNTIIVTNKIVLTNNKSRTVTVDVHKSFYGDWEILNSDLPYTKENSRLAKFSVTIPSEKETAFILKVKIKQ